MTLTSAESELWRAALQAKGFSDDGDVLQGPVSWVDAADREHLAKIEISLVGFPFRPPACTLLDSGTTLAPTFHLDRAPEAGGTGAMCLWDDDYAVDAAPWRDSDAFLARVAGWLRQSSCGWPGDTTVDLERYLPADAGPLVVYDSDEICSLVDVAVRSSALGGGEAMRITAEVRSRPEPARPGRKHRKDRRLVWLADLGAIDAPVNSWSTLKPLLGSSPPTVRRHIQLGVVSHLLLRYTHTGNPGVLVVRARLEAGAIALTACESADSSTATRTLRAGPLFAELATVRVAIIGCGAIGSFLADLLYRSGARHLTLVDYDRLRPGNLVRHLAGPEHLGRLKVEAVRSCLARHGDVSLVQMSVRGIRDLEQAKRLITEHDVVVDATASPSASSILATAATQIASSCGHYLVSVCTQRNGEVARVDRFPLRRGETHLQALPGEESPLSSREHGCGSDVATSPPGAVIHAAELAARVVIDAGTRQLDYPATLIDVLEPQPEPAFARRGVVTSQDEPLNVVSLPVDTAAATTSGASQ